MAPLEVRKDTERLTDNDFTPCVFEVWHIFNWADNTLQIAKHAAEAKCHQHHEEDNWEESRARKLVDDFCHCNKSKTSSTWALQQNQTIGK